LFQGHPAAAVARRSLHRITGTGTTAIAEKQPASFQTDPLDRVATATFGRVGGIEFALAPFLAVTEQGLIIFDFDDMMPTHRLAAGTVSRLLTQGVAVTVVTTVTRVKDIRSRRIGYRGLIGNSGLAANSTFSLVSHAAAKRTMTGGQYQDQQGSQPYPKYSWHFRNSLS
jgi:hypothetical protein